VIDNPHGLGYQKITVPLVPDSVETVDDFLEFFDEQLLKEPHRF
jgi:hypothetical protein